MEFGEGKMAEYVTLSTISGATIIGVNGPLKLGHPALDELHRYCCSPASPGEPLVVLDMEKVTGIDSSGIGVLLQGHTTVHNRGGDCVLLRPNHVVREVLDLVGLTRILRIAESLPDALGGSHTQVQRRTGT
jgi:anti-anti-sigma factor